MSAAITRKLEGQRAKEDKLVYAAENGDLALVESLLAGGVNVDTTTDNGMTVLMRAASNGHLHIVRMLLDHGAQLNTERNDGLTTLSLAAFHGRFEIVELLLRRGVDVQGKRGTSAQTLAKGRGFLRIVKLLEKARTSGLAALFADPEPAVDPEPAKAALEQPSSNPEITIEAPVSAENALAEVDLNSIAPADVAVEPAETEEEEIRDPGDRTGYSKLIWLARRKTEQAAAIVRALFPTREISDSTLLAGAALALVMIGLAAFSVVRMALDGFASEQTINSSGESGSTQTVPRPVDPIDSSPSLSSEQIEPRPLLDSRSSQSQKGTVGQVTQGPTNLGNLAKRQDSASDRTTHVRATGGQVAGTKQGRDRAGRTNKAPQRSSKDQDLSSNAPSGSEDTKTVIVSSAEEVKPKAEAEAVPTPAPLTVETTRERVVKTPAGGDEPRSESTQPSKKKKNVIQWP